MKELLKDSFSKDMIWVTGMFIIVVFIVIGFIVQGNNQDKEITNEFNNKYIVLEENAGTMICADRANGNVYHMHTKTDFIRTRYIIDSLAYDSDGNIENINK